MPKKRKNAIVVILITKEHILFMLVEIAEKNMIRKRKQKSVVKRMMKMKREIQSSGMLKRHIGCGCGNDNFKFTEITDNYGDVIKLKICKECGAVWDRDLG